MQEKTEFLTGMKLTVESKIYDEPTQFDTSESQIKMMLDNPHHVLDRHQALLRMLGTSKQYKYMTIGKLVSHGDQLILSYEESMLLGLSGDLMLFRFPGKPERRSILIIEKPGSGARLTLNKDRCMLNYSRTESSQAMFSVLTHRIENDITRGGGNLYADFEMSAYGVMMGRMSYSIKAVPYNDGDDYPFETPQDPILHLGRN